MICVADTNVLLTFFWKQSVLRSIITKQKLRLYAPEYALEEIKKYKEEIKKRTQLSKEEFKKIHQELVSQVTFIPLEKYIPSFSIVIGASQEFSSDEKKMEMLRDIDFLALSKQLNCCLWSNDKLLKRQHILQVLNTKEIVTIIQDNTD